MACLSTKGEWWCHRDASHLAVSDQLVLWLRESVHASWLARWCRWDDWRCCLGALLLHAKPCMMQAPCINCFAAYTCMGLARSASKSVCYRNPDFFIWQPYSRPDVILLLLLSISKAKKAVLMAPAPPFATSSCMSSRYSLLENGRANQPCLTEESHMYATSVTKRGALKGDWQTVL